MGRKKDRRKENYKRYISKPGVREQRLEYYKAYYDEHKEERKAYFKDYYKNKKAQRRNADESTNNL